jgi:hypothetical protein
MALDMKVDKELFFSIDYETLRRLRDLGYQRQSVPYILDFRKC